MGIPDSITQLGLQFTFRKFPDELRSDFLNLVPMGDWNSLVKICLDYIYDGSNPTQEEVVLNIESATKLALALRDLVLGKEEIDPQLKYLYLLLDDLLSHAVVKESGLDPAHIFGIHSRGYSPSAEIAKARHRYENGFFAKES